MFGLLINHEIDVWATKNASSLHPYINHAPHKGQCLYCQLSFGIDSLPFVKSQGHGVL